jgi:D-serine deaminase-like pyridoxal phosphate-dependent protein
MEPSRANLLRMPLDSLPTPALVVDRDALDRNVATMAETWPGTRLRPHVKAFKSTAMARELAERGHTAFCAATAQEIEGLAEAGLGSDLLLANELVDPERLGRLAALDARVTLAVDSPETVAAAADAGVREVLIDVNVGLPRCGCRPDDAGRLADAARARGLSVRGVMGYEGHLVGLEDRRARTDGTAESMSELARAHAMVGGDVISGGGTGTWDVNRSVTELQAGSYLLMDTAYATLDLPFEQALTVLATVISVSADGYAVADAGLKALGMDHGNPTIEDAKVWFCSDEHITFSMRGGAPLPSVGDRIRVLPAHVDPTVAYHDRFVLVRGDEVLDEWPVDLRGW